MMIAGWKYLSPPTSWLGLGLVAVLAAALTGLSAWHLSLTPPERTRLTTILAISRWSTGASAQEKLRECFTKPQYGPETKV
jgi:hypothetical protein